jgi:hypothetical protein
MMILNNLNAKDRCIVHQSTDHLIHQMIEEIDMVCMEEFPSKKIFPFFYRDVIYIPSHDTSLLSLE